MKTLRVTYEVPGTTATSARVVDHGTRSRSRFLLLLLLLLATCAITGSIQTAHGQSARVECLDPVRPGCEIVARSGPAKLPINVILLGPDNTPIENASVTFTTSDCCLEPASAQQARTSPTGIASIVWSGTVPDDPDAVVRVYVWGNTPLGPVRDTVLVRPRQTAFTYQLEPRDPRHIWFRDDQIPDEVMFDIKKLDGNRAVDMTEAECDQIQVAFTPHLGGSAGPSPANARWDKACSVGAQWKLANTVGTQYLHANVVGTQGARRVDANAKAVSRHPPRFVAGFGVLADRDEGQDRVRGVFGVEIPFFWETTCPLEFCERLRVVLGSSFANPADDYYGGIVLIPLIAGPSREGLPIQFSANYAVRDGFFGGLSVDASSLLQLAVQRLLPK